MNVVGLPVACVVDEAEVVIGIFRAQPGGEFFGAVTRDDCGFANTVGDKAVHDAADDGFARNPEERLVSDVAQRAHAARVSRRQNNGSHIDVVCAMDNGHTGFYSNRPA